MPKNVGELSLKNIFGLIEKKVEYLKGLIDEKSPKNHSHSANQVTGLSKTISSASIDTEIPSSKAVYDAIQSALTVNSTEVAT